MRTKFVQSYNKFRINESNFSEFGELIKHLEKFSWVKMSIDGRTKLSIDKFFGEGIFEEVEEKAKKILKSFQIIDWGYIEDKLTDLLDDRDYDSARVLFGIASTNFRFTDGQTDMDPKLRPNFPNIFGNFQSYSVSYTEQEEFIDILVVKILLTIVDYTFVDYKSKERAIFGLDIDKCLNYFLPYVQIQILNPESRRFSARDVKSDLETILPSILPNLDYCGIIWPSSNNWTWDYKVKILLN